jgi:hypothetical protein
MSGATTLGQLEGMWQDAKSYLQDDRAGVPEIACRAAAAAYGKLSLKLLRAS